jgi:hypothetical protein
MKLVRLTRPDGAQIWFGGADIVEPAPSSAAPGTASTVIVNGVQRYVRESIEEVLVAFGHKPPVA